METIHFPFGKNHFTLANNEIPFFERAVQIVGHTHIVLIEDTKDERCEFTGIALRKELFVDFDEALEKAGRGESKREGAKDKCR